jgi:hypothetical protein
MATQLSTNEKKLTDIALVTYLVCENFKIKGIEKSKDKFKSYFVFDETPELAEATLKFFNREAKVEPNQYHETLRNLKSYARQ